MQNKHSTKHLRITVEGKTYDVEVEVVGADVPVSPVVRPMPARTAPVMAPSKPAASVPQQAASEGDVTSPLAALVIAVHVEVGQKVRAGDKLLTLEAMKMNTLVSAPRDGEVTAVHVAPADAVAEGQALLSLS